MLFTLYTAPLEDIIVKNKLETMCYADDTQLYVVCSRDNFPCDQVESCIREIRLWMSNNMLALNEGKTEVIRFSSKFVKGNQSRECDIQVGEVVVHSSPTVRDLGVLFDSCMSMKPHISNLCKLASFALWRISKIRHLLDQDSTEKLVHAFVTSRLDYCNSLLYGLPCNLLNKIQLIQNSAARVVSRTKKSDHITPVLSRLHWLPLQKRIEFKILCIVYKILHDMAPVYLQELLTIRSSGRALRSSVHGSYILHQPISDTAFYGDRAFSVCAPRLWNRLPFLLRSCSSFSSFKANLKTHLFKEYF